MPIKRCSCTEDNGTFHKSNANFLVEVKLVSRQEPPAASEPISRIARPSRLLPLDRIIYEMQKASWCISWRINAYPIVTRALDDRLLIPADGTLRFVVRLYLRIFQRSFHAIKLRSPESSEFSGMDEPRVTASARIDGVGPNNALRLTLRRALI
jgi:hypothetical protein